MSDDWQTRREGNGPYGKHADKRDIRHGDQVHTERNFVSVRNADDEWLYLGVEHIRIVLMSTDLVTEGHETIREDMRPGTDNDGEDGDF